MFSGRFPTGYFVSDVTGVHVEKHNRVILTDVNFVAIVSAVTNLLSFPHSRYGGGVIGGSFPICF